MYVTNITNDYDNITSSSYAEYDDATSSKFTDYDNTTLSNCTNKEKNIDITIPTLLITIPCGLSLLCLTSLMVYTLIKPFFRFFIILVILSIHV